LTHGSSCFDNSKNPTNPIKMDWGVVPILRKIGNGILGECWENIKEAKEKKQNRCFK
jgi:hypothetical protein